MKKWHLFLVIIAGCLLTSEFTGSNGVIQPARAAASNESAQLGKICKASTAFIFGHPYKIMKLDSVSGNIAYVHYIRASDESRWAIKCKLDGQRVLWASDNPDSLGRWRNDPADEVITYSLSGTMLTLKQTYSDGSGEEKTFNIK